MRLKYSADIAKEMRVIFRYVRKNFGLKVAERSIKNIYDNLDLLCKNPFMGKSCDRHDENFRQIFFKPNVIIYDINDEVIEILHIVDARMDYVTNLL